MDRQKHCFLNSYGDQHEAPSFVSEVVLPSTRYSFQSEISAPAAWHQYYSCTAGQCSVPQHHGCSYAGQCISNTSGLMTPSSAPPRCGSTTAITLQKQEQVGKACPEWFWLPPSKPCWPHFQADRQLPHIKHKLLSPL